MSTTGIADGPAAAGSLWMYGPSAIAAGATATVSARAGILPNNLQNPFLITSP
jgi:hypothetical protein